MFNVTVLLVSILGIFGYGFLSYNCLQMLKTDIKKKQDITFTLLFTVIFIIVFLLCIGYVIAFCHNLFL